MKPEDVPKDWVDMGKKAHTLFPRLPRIPMPPYPTSEDARELLIREILAVVAPLIAAAERERALAATRAALNAYGRWNGAITPDTLMAKIEPAIRALGDVELPKNDSR